MLLGTGTVVAIYLLINAAFLHALGLVGVAHSNAIAAEVLSLRLGSYGSRAISLLVVISCLGAINGMLFTGARVFYALGTDHPIFRWLGKWNQRSVPLRSLVLQTLVTLGLVLACREQAGFERLVVFTAPFYWGFIAHRRCFADCLAGPRRDRHRELSRSFLSADAGAVHADQLRDGRRGR